MNYLMSCHGVFVRKEGAGGVLVQVTHARAGLIVYGARLIWRSTGGRIWSADEVRKAIFEGSVIKVMMKKPRPRVLIFFFRPRVGWVGGGSGKSGSLRAIRIDLKVARIAQEVGHDVIRTGQDYLQASIRQECHRRRRYRLRAPPIPCAPANQRSPSRQRRRQRRPAAVTP